MQITCSMKWYSAVKDKSVTLILPEDTTVSSIYIQVNKGNTSNFVNEFVQLMVNEGETALPYEPYNKLTKVKPYIAKRNSKNLIPFPYTFDSKTSNGITITALKDGQFSIVGTNTANGFTDFQFGTIKNLPVGEYTISCSSVKYVRFMVQKRVNGVFICNYNIGYQIGRLKQTFSVTEDEKQNNYLLFVSCPKSFSSETPIMFDTMFNEGTTAEPYFTLE